MNKSLIFIYACGFIILLISVLKQLNTGDKKSKAYIYKRKQFLISPAEHKCFDALVEAVGDKYHVFPQIHLATIMDNKVIGQNWKGAFRHIDEKSVDFVLCDKAYIAPQLAIELDDYTHQRADRVVRDREVERILEGSGLPLLRLENHGHFDPSVLAEQIHKMLNNTETHEESNK